MTFAVPEDAPVGGFVLQLHQDDCQPNRPSGEPAKSGAVVLHHSPAGNHADVAATRGPNQPPATSSSGEPPLIPDTAMRP